MKNFRLIAHVSLLILALSGCRTVDKSKSLANVRDALDQAEPFRHTLPEEGKSPDRPQFPSIKTAKLKNGLVVMVVEDKRLPIAAISFVSKNGSARDGFGKSGLMHLTGTMLKEGSATKTSLELAEEFANLGSEASVNVGKDMTAMTAAVLSDKVAKVIELFGEMVKTPRMADEDFERVKMQHISLLSSQQGVPSYVAQTSFLMAAYGDKHPYAYPSAGTVAGVVKLTLNEIKESHKNYFGPNISAIIAVGDVTLEQIKALAKKNFGSWSHKSASLAKISDPPVPKRMQTRLVVRAHSPQTYLLLGQPVIAQKDNDRAALEVLQSILAGMPTSRLDAKLREEKGWTYGVSSGSSPMLGKGPFMVASSVQIPYGTDALNEILREFEQLKKEPVSEAELTSAKNGILHSFGNRYSTVNKVAANLAEQFTYALPENYNAENYDRISKVTAKDVKAVANRVLKKDQTIAVAVGDLDAMEAPIAKADVGTVTIER